MYKSRVSMQLYIWPSSQLLVFSSRLKEVALICPPSLLPPGCTPIQSPVVWGPAGGEPLHTHTGSILTVQCNKHLLPPTQGQQDSCLFNTAEFEEHLNGANHAQFLVIFRSMLHNYDAKFVMEILDGFTSLLWPDGEVPIDGIGSWPSGILHLNIFNALLQCGKTLKGHYSYLLVWMKLCLFRLWNCKICKGLLHLLKSFIHGMV